MKESQPDRPYSREAGGKLEEHQPTNGIKDAIGTLDEKVCQAKLKFDFPNRRSFTRQIHSGCR
jgi:hypothetical protein